MNLELEKLGGWWAAAVAAAGALGYAFRVGAHVARVEVKVDRLINDMEYLTRRLDQHIDRERGQGD